jgi:protein-tyrosine phosphatase
MNATEIVPGIWLGDFADGIRWAQEGKRTLCVLEGRRPDMPATAMWVPILAGDPPIAQPSQLWTAGHVIARHREHGPALLVHCAAGVERAPLVIAWWLAHFEKRPLSLGEAFALIESKRKIRRAWNWLPPAYRP